MPKHCVLVLLLFLPLPSVHASDIRPILAHPIFKVGFACIEHGADSAKWDLGDAFGTDCFVEDLVEIDGRTWARPYKANGNENKDWYGWQREVLSPCTCRVLEMNINTEPNRPGVMGTQPASLLKLKRSDGVIFHVAHFDKPLVKVGDALVAGQVIARVGNNGLSHHPHIHIGAYQGVESLQIRFDQRFIQPLENAIGR